ncbi:hypothetical protein ACFQPC_08170 [Herminiimonas glaciei]|uniref:Uncharacterized protein n=1 Tax=Herminiimonas glaciei TaxID=523788 RepID=A0ABW2IAP5_9BURK
MRMTFLCLLLVTSTFVPLWAQAKLPADVARFVEKRDGCDHFRGEEAYDEERRQFLLKNMNKLCRGTDARLLQLKKKYAGRPAVIGKLNDYEEQIEAGSSKP